MIVKCDADEAYEAMHQRYERFEALSCHLGMGIRDGIKAHNTHEGGCGFPPAAPEEITMALADAVASHFGYDETAIERFIESLRLCIGGGENFLEFLDQHL